METQLTVIPAGPGAGLIPLWIAVIPADPGAGLIPLWIAVIPADPGAGLIPLWIAVIPAQAGIQGSRCGRPILQGFLDRRKGKVLLDELIVGG